MYFEGNKFLHYKLVDDLLKEHEVVLDRNKLCIKLDGKYVEDVNMIKRKMLDYDNTLTMKHMNEVINRLKLVVKLINYNLKPPSSSPVLLGEVYDDKKVKVWCPFCKTYHHHGYDPKDKEKEHHRAAHCKTETPFSEIGYIIKISG